MVVYVDDREVHLFPGMTVEHALIRARALEKIREGMKVYDEWGNEMGLAGALWDGARLYVR